MTGKTKAGALACLVWVSGCASPSNQAALENLNVACQDQYSPAWQRDIACARIPRQEAINRDEANRNLGVAVALPLLLPLAVLVALADSDVGGGGGSAYHVYHHHHHGGFHGGHGHR